MPTSKANKRYPALDRLSTDELEALVAKDFDSDEEPDMDFIEAIMEVIAQRENPHAEQDAAETEDAWQRFQADYKDKIPESNDVNSGTPSPADPIPTSPKPVIRKHRRKVGQFIAVAAIVVILGGTLVAQGFGFNVWQAFAQWTHDTFHFGTGPTLADALPPDSTNLLEPFANLLLEDDITTSVIPKKYPGYLDSIEYTSNSFFDRAKYYCELKDVDNNIKGTITIIHYFSGPNNYSRTYEKDNNDITEYVVNDIIHYVMANNFESKVSWTNNDLEGTIRGQFTEEELLEMINSIYEE